IELFPIGWRTLAAPPQRRRRARALHHRDRARPHARAGGPPAVKSHKPSVQKPTTPKGRPRLRATTLPTPSIKSAQACMTGVRLGSRGRPCRHVRCAHLSAAAIFLLLAAKLPLQGGSHLTVFEFKRLGQPPDFFPLELRMVGCLTSAVMTSGEMPPPAHL